MKFAEQFYIRFRRTHRKSPFRSGIHEWGFWTRSTLRALEDLGEGMGYRVMKENQSELT
jgi:hypothetical protein